MITLILILLLMNWWFDAAKKKEKRMFSIYNSVNLIKMLAILIGTFMDECFLQEPTKDCWNSNFIFATISDFSCWDFLFALSECIQCV